MRPVSNLSDAFVDRLSVSSVCIELGCMFYGRLRENGPERNSERSHNQPQDKESVGFYFLLLSVIVTFH